MVNALVKVLELAKAASRSKTYLLKQDSALHDLECHLPSTRPLIQSEIIVHAQKNRPFIKINFIKTDFLTEINICQQLTAAVSQWKRWHLSLLPRSC